MALDNVLKNMRSSNYSSSPKEGMGESSPKSMGPRMFKLTPDEMKGLNIQPGMTMDVIVTGRIDDKGMFSVVNVSSNGDNPEDKEMSSEMMGNSPKMGM